MDKRTKVFFDTEFTGLHQNTTLISIGLISECGKTFYAELTDYDKSQIDEWLQTNVIENLFMPEPKDGEQEYFSVSRHDDNPIGNDLYKSYSVQLRCDKKVLEVELGKWLSQFEEVEMWSDCLSYDWVLFNQIWGHAFSVPHNIYYIPFDLSSLLKIYGYNPDLSRKEFSGLNEPNHNALSDAKMIKLCYEKVFQIQSEKQYYVYGYYDENNNLFYVGKGKGKRMFYHLYDSQSLRKDKTMYNPHKTNKIKSAVNKVGIDYFIENHIRIIEKDLTEAEALRLEKELILKYGKIIDKTGILTNITDGGTFCIGNHFKSKEHREKISNTLQGHKRTEESKRKQSNSVKGVNNVNYKQERPDFVKEAVRRANSKKIIFKNVEYSSITDCAKAYNVSRTTITRWMQKQ